MENIEMGLEVHLKTFHWCNSDHLIIDQSCVEKFGWPPISVCMQNAWKQDKVINADSTVIVLIIHLISQDGKNGKDKDVLFILNMVWSGLIWSGKISRMIWFQLGLMSTRMIHVIYVCIYAYILLQKCTMSRLFLKHTHTMWKSNAVFYLGIIGNTNF